MTRRTESRTQRCRFASGCFPIAVSWFAALACLAGLSCGSLVGATPRVEWTHLSSTTGDLPAPPGGTQQTACVVADADGDGITDFFIADRSVAPSLVLYTRGSNGWSRSVVDPEKLPIEAGGAVADIDGDGDLDLVFGRDGSGGVNGGIVWWWENPLPGLPVSSTWTRRVIKSGGRQQHDQGFGDFDGDGKVEFATWVNQSQRLEIYEIPEDPTVSPWNLAATVAMTGEGLRVADVDLDGTVDILAGTKWMRHEGGGSYNARDIDANYPLTTSRIVSGQFIPGGRPEVVLSSGDGDGPVNLYVFDGAEWIRTTLMAEVIHGHSLEVGDIDQDGHLDFFVAEMGDPGAGANCTAWIAWGDGAGNFEFEVLSVGLANHESRLADLDGDGDLDILTKPYHQDAPRVDVWLNRGRNNILSLDHWQRRAIDAAIPWQPLLVTTGDVDGDGLPDIITGGWWYRNPGSIAGNWVRSAIGGELRNMAWVADFDDDGDLDIFGTNGRPTGGVMGWAENNGSGSFSYHGNIDPGNSTRIFQGALGATFAAGQPYQIAVQWNHAEDDGTGVDAFTVPENPATDLWVKSVLHANSSGEDMSAGDIDGDGDLDIFQGRSWLRNQGDGTWDYSAVATFPAEYGMPDRNNLVDIDGDGDLDAVVGMSDFTADATPLYWLEHPDDPTLPWPVHTVATGVWGGYSLDSGDIDHDGDIDIVLGEHRGATRTLIFENTGHGTAWIHHVVDAGGAGIDHHDGTTLFDLDGDGDLDIVSIGWDNDKLWIFENTSPASHDVQPPTAPTGFTATAVVGPAIELHWHPATDDTAVTSYLVYRDGTLLATVTGTEYRDSDVAGDSPHVYAVRARDGSGNESEASASVAITSLSPSDQWWHTAWPYRTLITVAAAGTVRIDAVVDVSIDYTALLAQHNLSATLATSSLRVVEVDAPGAVRDPAVPVQFDPAPDFDARTAARGRLIFPLRGTTPAASTRYFHVYFAPVGSGATPLTFAPDIAVLDGVVDEDQSSIQITTLTGDLYYQRAGGAFSSWDDIAGNDWIGYAPTGGTAGSFRGIPNLVHPEGHFRPGTTTSTTTIEHQGPLKATLHSTTLDGGWECRWEIYGTVARMTVLAAAAPYWFLYEGTPGGTLEPDTDLVVRSTGATTPASQSWLGDLAGDEWVYLADPGISRSLFVAQHDPDPSVDSYRPLDGAMTVLGFGRDLRVGRFLTTVPKTFTIGLVDDIAYDAVRTAIESAFRTLTVTISSAALAPDVEAPSAPTSLRIDHVTATSARFSWQPSTDNEAVVGYLIYRDNAAGDPIGSSGGPDFEDTGLLPDTVHVYFVSAFDAAANESELSNGLQITTPTAAQVPATPTGLAGLALSATEIRLSWTASSDDGDVVGYLVFRDGSLAGSSATTEFVDSGLSPASTHQYVVTAVDDEALESAPSAALRATTLADTTPPTIPQDLTAHGISSGEILLSWSAATDDHALAGYRVYRDGILIAEVMETTHLDAGLAPNSEHSYAVEAYDSFANLSGHSGSVSGATLPEAPPPPPPLPPPTPPPPSTPPTAPQELVATSPDGTTVFLSWTNSSDDVGVAYYLVLRNDVALANTTAVRYVDRTLDMPGTYRYRVLAVDSDRNRSDSSSETSILVGGMMDPDPGLGMGFEQSEAAKPAEFEAPAEVQAPIPPAPVPLAPVPGSAINRSQDRSVDDGFVPVDRLGRDPAPAGVATLPDVVAPEPWPSLLVHYESPAASHARAVSVLPSFVVGGRPPRALAPAIPGVLTASCLAASSIPPAWTAATTDGGIASDWRLRDDALLAEVAGAAIRARPGPAPLSSTVIATTAPGTDLPFHPDELPPEPEAESHEPAPVYSNTGHALHVALVGPATPITGARCGPWFVTGPESGAQYLPVRKNLPRPDAVDAPEEKTAAIPESPAAVPREKDPAPMTGDRYDPDSVSPGKAVGTPPAPRHRLRPPERICFAPRI